MNNDDKKIAETTLFLLKRKNWIDLSLVEIKNRSKIKSFDKLIKNKNKIIEKINKYFDYKLSLVSNKLEKSNNKDMIFEVIMMRFDILQEHRKGVISIFESFKTKPHDLIFLLPNIIDSIILMINFTKISLKGIMGQLKTKGILIIYIHSFFTWMNDDTDSLEKTMTILDKDLDQAGKILKIIK